MHTHAPTHAHTCTHTHTHMHTHIHTHTTPHHTHFHTHTHVCIHKSSGLCVEIRTTWHAHVHYIAHSNPGMWFAFETETIAWGFFATAVHWETTEPPTIWFPCMQVVLALPDAVLFSLTLYQLCEERERGRKRKTVTHAYVCAHRRT